MRTSFSLCVVLAALLAGSVLPSRASSIAPIHVGGNADFAACGCARQVDGVWVIGPWSISGAPGDGVLIENVTAPFRLVNMTVTNSKGAGVHLKNVDVGGATVISGTQTSLQNNLIGLVVEQSHNITADGGGANPAGWGIVASGKAGTINKNKLGAIDVVSSSGVVIRGWVLSANGQDGMPDWVTFDPGIPHWSVGGVRFLHVAGSTIDHNSANNDTSISYSLWSSSNNRVTWNTGDYPFTANLVLANGSSYNTVYNNSFGTADFVGVLVADPLKLPQPSTFGSSSNNTITYNTIHSSGPTGHEIHSGVVPDFLGGIVILNSASNNEVEYNQLWQNTGNDLKWVQATLDPSSRIGVVAYPVIAVCNVSPTTPPFNGNVWSGNSFKTVDVCPSGPLQR